MTDTYGNGWDCAYADIYDCEGNLLAAEVAPPNADGEDCSSWTQHDAGAFSAADLCLPDENGYTIVFTSGAYDGEIGWSLVYEDGEVALSGGAPGEYTTCPPPPEPAPEPAPEPVENPCDGNSYDFHMTDTYGNGWDCAYADIYDCEGNLLAAEVAPPNADGEDCSSWTQHDAGAFSAADLCLPDADGYTVTFTSGAYDGEIGWSLLDADGTVALSGGAPGEFTTCPPPPEPAPEPVCSAYDFHMTDSYGNGWDCAYADIYDCAGNLIEGEVAPPNLDGEDCYSWTVHDAGTFSAADLCLPDADGYTIVFTPGLYDEEIGWSLLDEDGGVAMSGSYFDGIWPGEYSTCVSIG